MKKFFKEFKEFITKGNILDMAIGVIIGGAFNTIVTTLNKYVLMPIVNWALSYISGGSELCTVLPNYTLYDPTNLDHAGSTPVIVNGVSYYSVNYINWSAFIESIINFFFVALTLFIIVKVAKYASRKRAEMIEKMKKEEDPVEEPVVEEVAEPEPDPVVVLLQEIRDSLKTEPKKEKEPSKSKKTKEE
ncbi:MAG: MscL family protein [Anaeroplasmataceae bacterium]|nr:MscL family protein [Anaeroplasmataceae bacterium]